MASVIYNMVKVPCPVCLIMSMYVHYTGTGPMLQPQAIQHQPKTWLTILSVLQYEKTIKIAVAIAYGGLRTGLYDHSFADNLLLLIGLAVCVWRNRCRRATGHPRVR